MKSVFSPVEMGLPSGLRALLTACGAAAALAMAGASQAATVTGVNTFTTADGHASVLFNLDFGADLDLAAFGATLTFDDTLLSLDALNPAAITLGSATLPDDFLETSVFVAPGSLSALFFLSPPFVSVSSQVQVQFNFLTTLTPGQLSDVNFAFDFVDAADPDLASVTLPTATATVTGAVPEPESLALLLAGAGIVAACGRRRATGPVHA